MKVVDLSQTLCPGTPVFPGDGPVVIVRTRGLQSHGFALSRLEMDSHAGTHVDAPAHVLAGAPGLRDLPVGAFVGPGCVLDLSGRGPGIIEARDLEPFSDLLCPGRFALLRTDWSERWGRIDYFSAYPGLSLDAARLLAGQGLMGLGLDTPSPDPAQGADLAAHRLLLSGLGLVVENLTGLKALPPAGFTFVCLPLKLDVMDGSPARAVALLP
ncbi:MAG: cyclase family protein [Desulfovibrionaceae bacterium]|nr:cyclase family protein [Desulfovibrionaceae bacterium]